MSKRSEYVIRWRKNTKKRIIDAFGGKCCMCGYNKCNEALELHHLNPEEKDFSFGAVRASIKSWSKIVKELRKCILVCSNCHKEIHYNNTEIKHPVMFNEEFCEYKKEKFGEVNACPICGNMKPAKNFYCSLKCAAKARGKVNWENVDLVSMIKQGMTFVSIAETLSVSDSAVRKRAKKLGLI